MNSTAKIFSSYSAEAKQTYETPTSLIFANINKDGGGDFGHLTDIYYFLKSQPKIKAQHIIPVISIEDPGTEEEKQRQTRLKNKIVRWLAEQQITEYHLAMRSAYEAKYLENTSLQKQLKEADQVIKLSYFKFPEIEKYLSYCKSTVVYKFFGEHESFQGEHSYSMGLSKGPYAKAAYGLKLKKIGQARPQEFTALLENKATQATFVKKLLNDADVKDFNAFHQHNLLIPAYYNTLEGLSKVMLFPCSMNHIICNP